MENDKLIKALHILADTPSCTKSCSQCPANEFRTGDMGACDDGTMIAAATALEAHNVEIADLSAQLAELQKRFDAVNDFERSQCAKLLAQLTEKDKQLGLAVEDLNFIMRHSGERAVCKLCTHNCIINSRVKPKCCDAVWRGAQEVGEGGG